MNEACLTFIHALSPLHAGTGQGVGVIDLPIAREKATNLPYLPGSTLKGSMRDELSDKALQEQVFGRERPDSDSAYAGSAIFTDQRLLCLPVRSIRGTFAWVTSPFILERLKRDALNTPKRLPAVVGPTNEQNCLVSATSELTIDGKVVLEDLDLKLEGKGDSDNWANEIGERVFVDPNWRDRFKKRFCIVSDDVMSFLAETATEVIARNVLSEEKTSQNLWYEEALPGETILSGLLVAVHVKATSDIVFNTIKQVTRKPIQLGGSMTVGRGLCQVTLDYRLPE